LALGIWWLYLRTLSPAFPPDDSPETIAAAWTLGIQHPPGYPLPTLLGRLSIVLAGLGSAAWRMNLLSAFLGLTAAGLAGALAWRLLGAGPGRASAAVFAALSLATYAPFWDQATEAKGGIYLLNLALGFGFWHALLSAAEASPRALRLAFLLAGLMLAGHFLSAGLWLLPGAVWLWRKRHGLKGSMLDALFLLPGAALYLYLPLRAAQAPLLDWGHPSTLKQFLWMLSRAGYTQAGLTQESGLVASQVSVFARALGTAALGTLPWLALGGAWVLWRRERLRAAVLLGAAGLGLLAGAVFNRTPADNRWLVLIFTLPCVALLAPLAGVGLGSLAGRFGLRSWFWLLPALLLPGLAAWRAAAARDRSQSFVAYDYAHDLALSLPRGALYVAEGDYHVLPFTWLQAAGRRRDVTLLLAVLAGQAWYQDCLRARQPDLLFGSGTDAEAARALVRAEAARRPVLLGPYSGSLDAAALPGLELRQRGLVREVAPVYDGPVPDVPAAWFARAPGRDGAAQEPVEAALLPWYTVALVQAGNEALDAHRVAEAIQRYRQALGRPGAKPAAAIGVNLGRAWEQAGSSAAARAAYEAALAADPGFEPAKLALTALQARSRPGALELLARADRLAAQGGHDEEAFHLYDQAMALGYQNAAIWTNMGVLLLRNGRREAAVKAFRRGLELSPADPRLQSYLQAALAFP
jgi:tetratricopeptide (TPR) repeat protein